MERRVPEIAEKKFSHSWKDPGLLSCQQKIFWRAVPICPYGVEIAGDIRRFAESSRVRGPVRARRFWARSVRWLAARAVRPAQTREGLRV